MVSCIRKALEESLLGHLHKEQFHLIQKYAPVQIFILINEK